MIQLPLAFQSGDTLLAELDPDHYITDKKRVVAKLTADNLWVKPVVPIVPSEFVSIANAEHKRLTEPYRWMQEYQKTQVFKHLDGQHDQYRHAGGGRGRFDRPDEYQSLDVPFGELPDTVYHVTASKNNDAISIDGLQVPPEGTWNTGAGPSQKFEDEWIWGRDDNGDWAKEEYRPVGVYVFGSRDSAESYAQSGDSIYAIDTKQTISMGADVIRDPSWSENWDYMDDPERESAWVFTNVPVEATSLILDKHLGGQHDQATHGRKTFNYSNAADLFGDIESLQASVEALTDPSQSAFVNGNVALKVLLERQGRNGRPEVFESMEALEAVNPDGEILYRGTDQSHKDALMNDEFGRVGTGNHGAGYYFVENQNMAQSYADGPSALGAYDNPTVVQAKMNPNAKVKSFKDSKEMHNFGREAQTKAIQDMTAIDPSAMRTGDFVLTNFYGMFDAAASTQLILEGFDAMTFDRGGGNQYTVVFNREVMQVVAD